MSEIHSGNLTIRTMGEKIAFDIVGKTAACAVLNSRELPVLLEFLNSYLASQSNRRIGFRIDLRQLGHDIADRFCVVVEAESKKLVVTPIDLSITGIYIESEKFTFKHGSQVVINLSYDDKLVALPAVAIRQDNSHTHTHTAFHFVGMVEDGELAPPSELDAIYHALEALWLNNSLDLKWSDQESGKTNILDVKEPE
ncbi:MAG: PilZ domain-containing protein [Proteobacteria bacterium]|nr:PilZ domain-containing protein [Pseudomonadota bacterium]